MSPNDTARLDVEDLAILADEATRMGWSLACLIGAMQDGEAIAWCCEEKRMKYRIKYYEGRWHIIEPNGEVTWHFVSLNAAFDWIYLGR